MVYTGKPSAGCENCRKSKKRCDQELPACGRCVRLGKACGGYRDLNELMFRNETASILRRASSNDEATTAGGSSSSTNTGRNTPEIGIVARQYFFTHLVTSTHLSFLDGVSPDEFLLKPIIACALAAMSNRDNDQDGREVARRHYVDAINATNTALRHPQRVREDNTLMSVCLLSIYERIAWEPHTYENSWQLHVEGAAQVLHLRGRNQIRTQTGAMIFREIRNQIINNALFQEAPVPDFIVQWTQALEYNPAASPSDQLILLSARFATIRLAFRTGSSTDVELMKSCAVLERDLLTWSEDTLAAGSVCSFYNVRDPDSPHSWNGTRHEYGIPEAHRYWNRWRCLRITLSRVQEAIWRRSWPDLVSSTHPLPDREHYRAIRNRMVADICVAVSYAFGNDTTADPPRGSIASGNVLIMPLALAGTCLLEQMVEPTVSPGGSRLISVDEPLHTDLFSQTSSQLAWIIDKAEYIASKCGLKYAGGVASFLKGQTKIYYDIERSRVVRPLELQHEFHGQLLDLGAIMSLADLEESSPEPSA